MDNETICKARQANLVEYLQRKGERLVKDYGQTYHLAAHDSLKVTGNKFYWFSQGFGGNALDFAVKYYGLPFREAVEELTGVSVAQVQPTPAFCAERIMRTYEAKPTALPERADNERRVLAYLIQKRGLSYETVTRSIKDGLLYQDVRGNCVFVIRDYRTGEALGYELRGTSEAKFCRISEHRGFGFHVYCTNVFDVTDEIDSVLFFESAIDLLSYKQFYRPYMNELLVSMGGVNPSVVENAATLYPHSELVICADNDEAGEHFAARIAERYPDRTRRKAPPEEKDWNDFLLEIRGEK